MREMNFIILVIGILAIAAGVALSVINAGKIRKGEVAEKIKYHKPLIVIGLVIMVLSQCFVIIGTGQTGVRITFGQVDNRVVSQGFNIKIPVVQSIKTVNNRQQDVRVVGESESIESTIKGKVPISISDISVTYQITSEKSAYIYQKVSDPNNLLTYNLVSSAIKATTPSFDTDGVVVRSEVEAAVKTSLQKYVNSKYEEGVMDIIQVTLGNISFTDEYNQSVNEKNVAIQQAEKQAIDNQRTVDTANADAEALLIKAKAEKEANELMQVSLTNEILVQQYLEKWDGKLPTVTGSDGSVMLDIDKLMDGSAPN